MEPFSFDMDEFERAMRAFSLRDHQRVVAYLRTMNRAGFTVHSVAKYVERKIKENELFETLRSDPELWPKCPKCAGMLTMGAITIPKGKSNVFGHKSHFFCASCGYERYGQKRLALEVVEILKGREGARTNFKKRKRNRAKRLKSRGKSKWPSRATIQTTQASSTRPGTVPTESPVRRKAPTRKGSPCQ